MKEYLSRRPYPRTLYAPYCRDCRHRHELGKHDAPGWWAPYAVFFVALCVVVAVGWAMGAW